MLEIDFIQSYQTPNTIFGKTHNYTSDIPSNFLKLAGPTRTKSTKRCTLRLTTHDIQRALQ